MADELWGRSEISDTTKASLAQRFTTNFNQVMGANPDEIVDATPEVNALLECYVTCLNIMVAHQDDRD